MAVEVQLDGAPFRAFDAPQPIDPGSHRVVASAPGKLDFARELTLAEGQSLAIELPPLEPSPAAPVSPVVAPTVATEAEAAPRGSDRGAVPGADTSSTKLVPWTLVGVGGAVLAGGIVTGVVAARKVSDLKDDCPNRRCDGDLSQRDAAKNTALVADILMGTGLLMAGAGVTWLILTKEDDASATDFSASCNFAGCGATLRGRF